MDMYGDWVYSALKDVVRQRQYKDVAFKLRNLGREGVAFAKSDDTTALLNDRKDNCLRGILFIMKYHDDYGLYGQDFIDMANGARKVGLNWPELDIIEKAAKSMPENPHDIDEAMHIDLKSSREQILDRLEQIFNDPGTDVFDRIAELDIARNVLRRIEKSDVAEILAKYKNNIIKDTLHYMRHGVVEVDIPVYLETLQDLGANWPELTIIMNSFKKPKNTPLDENAHDDLDTVLASLKDDAVARPIKVAFNKMSNDMAEHYNRKPILDFLKFVDRYKPYIGNKNIHLIVNATKQKMLEYIEWVISNYSKPFADLTVTEPLSNTLKSIAWLEHHYGITWPELNTVLNTYKTAIIKTCLKQAKDANSYSIEDLEDLIKHLDAIGVNWPEIATIKKSVFNQLDESVNMTDHGVTMILNSLEDQLFDDIPYALAIIGDADRRANYGLVPAFDENKTEIMRVILKAIRDPDEYNLWFPEAFEKMIRGARLLGVDWPEFKAIERSIGSDELDEGEAGNSAMQYNLSGVLSSIKHDEPREMVLFLSQLVWIDKWGLAELTDYSKELTPHIKFIVKALLEFLKYESDDAEPIDTVRDCLRVLEKMNVSSPDLEIIKRSLAVGKSQ